MIFEAKPSLGSDADAALARELDALTPEQVEQRKNAIWSRTSAVDLIADQGKHKIVGEGDSWFDYLPGIDILDHLADMGHAIAKVAKAGDTFENMIYGTAYDRSFSRQPNPLDHTIKLLNDEHSPILLFSGGGNDVAGDELEAFLNHKDMGLNGPVRQDYKNHVLKTVVGTAYRHLIDRVKTDVGHEVHIISHGYGVPVADGRAVVNLPWGFHFIGPWLRPALTKKNYIKDAERRAIMKELIDCFNDTLRSLAQNAPNFHYLDLRTLITDDSWVNELHLRNSVFRDVAKQFEVVIQQVIGAGGDGVAAGESGRSGRQPGLSAHPKHGGSGAARDSGRN
jgi:hypothetical protein